MNLQTVIDNLDQTIAGKKKLLDSTEVANTYLREIRRINTEELRRIRDDLIKVRDGS